MAKEEEADKVTDQKVTHSRNELLSPELKDPLIEYERYVEGRWVRMVQVEPFVYVQYNYRGR